MAWSHVSFTLLRAISLEVHSELILTTSSPPHARAPSVRFRSTSFVAGGSLILALVALVLAAYATGDIGAAVLFALMMAALVFYAGLIVHAAAYWIVEAWRGLMLDRSTASRARMD